MKKVINTLVNILKGLKYPNTPQSEEEPRNTTQTHIKSTSIIDEYELRDSQNNELLNSYPGSAIYLRSLTEEEHYLIESSNTDPQRFHSNSSLNEEAALNNLLSNSNVRRAPSSYNY